jgi:hypothetical protein
MTPGTEVVVATLAHQFPALSIDHSFDATTHEVLLDFNAEGREFRARINHEFDCDYASGKVKIDLTALGTILRSSRNGMARVTTAGIQLVK